MKKNQYGFAAVEAVIIVVVLAVVAGLGWYVYQKNQKDDKKTTTSQNDNKATADTKNPNDNEQNSDVSDSYITISEWGVRAPYDGDQKLTLKFNDDKRFAYFGSEQLAALDSGCTFDGVGGMIRRFAPTDRTHVDDTGPTAEEAAKTDSNYHKLGNYYYRFVHSQSGCGDTDKTEALQQQVNALVEALVPKLVAVP